MHPRVHAFSREWADKCGLLGHAQCPVVLRPSRISGAGIGVWAVRDIPSGAYVTPYAGVVRRKTHKRPMRPSDSVYAFYLGDGCTLVGIRRPRSGHMKGYGVAQLANDAIHPDATGLKNNCDFEQHGHRVYLRTTRPVRAGEELFVSYHIQYWLHPNHSRLLKPKAKSWIFCVLQLQRGLHRRMYELEHYEGISNVPDQPDTSRVELVAACRSTSPADRVACCGSGTRVRRFSVFLQRESSSVVHTRWHCHKCKELLWTQRYLIVNRDDVNNNQ